MGALCMEGLATHDDDRLRVVTPTADRTLTGPRLRSLRLGWHLARCVCRSTSAAERVCLLARSPPSTGSWRCCAPPESVAVVSYLAAVAEQISDQVQLVGQTTADARCAERLADVEERELRDLGAKVWHDHSDPNQPSFGEGAKCDPARVDVMLEGVPLRLSRSARRARAGRSGSSS